MEECRRKECWIGLNCPGPRKTFCNYQSGRPLPDASTGDSHIEVSVGEAHDAGGMPDSFGGSFGYDSPSNEFSGCGYVGCNF